VSRRPDRGAGGLRVHPQADAGNRRLLRGVEHRAAAGRDGTDGGGEALQGGPGLMPEMDEPPRRRERQEDEERVKEEEYNPPTFSLASWRSWRLGGSSLRLIAEDQVEGDAVVHQVLTAGDRELERRAGLDALRELVAGAEGQRQKVVALDVARPE